MNTVASRSPLAARSARSASACASASSLAACSAAAGCPAAASPARSAVSRARLATSSRVSPRPATILLLFCCRSASSSRRRTTTAPSWSLMLASVPSNSSCCLARRVWKPSIRRCAASASVPICSTRHPASSCSRAQVELPSHLGDGALGILGDRPDRLDHQVLDPAVAREAQDEQDGGDDPGVAHLERALDPVAHILGQTPLEQLQHLRRDVGRVGHR